MRKNQASLGFIKLITIIFFASGAVLITAFFVVKFSLRLTPAQILQEKTPDQSQTQRKIRILIVPGHEPDYGGAEFGNIKERNLVVELGQDLERLLKADNDYQVFITRDTQAWSPIFADYFKNNWNDIVAWKKASRREMSRLISNGSTKIPVPAVSHNNIPANVAVRLYGINKWANENNIDLVIHVHINDYWGYPANVPGKYSGLVIYLPAQQYSNSTTTGAIAEAVFNRLAKYNPVSNLRQESSGLVSDSELIAVGANNTSDAANMLIEYDYIYEPQFVNPKIRGLALKDLAYQTYIGLQDFFGGSNDDDSANLYNPSLLYAWNNPATDKNSDPSDIYALQTALILGGEYPPAGKTKNNCPHSGIFGACTRAALMAFQNEYGISNKDGIMDEKTFGLLNNIYTGSGSALDRPPKKPYNIP